ncbi:MAG: prolyl oligopeptidase family serine peptidase [Bacteroidota bacterium]
MKRVGAPVPSPDGKRVVFSVTDPSYDDKEQRSDLWIVPSDGRAKPRQLTFNLAGEGGIAWSPDGKKIAFSAKREGDEVGQIYILNIAEGGEAIRFTSLSTGARAPKWRPDGTGLLFTSSVFPGAATDSANKNIASERKARKYKARVYDGYPIRSWDRWLDDTEPHIFVQMLEDTAKARDILAGTKLVDEPGFNGSDDLGATWTPDGGSIVFSATTKHNASAYAFVNTHLFLVSTAGSEPQQLTPDNGSYSSPMFSPDGKSLILIFNPTNQWEYNDNRLARMSWPEKSSPTILTESLDRSVGSYGITPDSKAIYFLAEEAGHEKLFSVAVSGGRVERVFDMNLGVYSNLAIPPNAPDTKLFARWESASSPAEVVAIDLKRKDHRFLSSVNTDRALGLHLPPLRDFWFTGKSGKRVHNMLVVPPGFDETQSYPLVVMIHGGPHTMWRDYFFLRWNYHLLATPGYVILLTDYTGSTGYGEKFSQAIQGDPFVGPAADIHEGIEEAIRRYAFIDTTRVAAMGASYGGHMVNWLQGTTTRFKCFVSHAGLINLESQWGTSDVIYHREIGSGGPVWEQGDIWRSQNPARKAANFKTPVLVTVGENDFRVPLNQSLEYWSYLQRLQVPSRLIVFPDENHWIMKGENSRFFYREVHAWLKKHLSSGKL